MTDIPTVTFYNKILVAAINVSDGRNSLGDHSPNSLWSTTWRGDLVFLPLPYKI